MSSDSNRHRNGNSKKRHVQDRLTTIFDSQTTIVDRIDELPKFKPDELQLGSVLGKGGFGTVREVKSFVDIDGADTTRQPDEDDTDGDDDDVLQGNRVFMAEHCLRKSRQARYAVKQLSPEVIEGSTCSMGMTDMAIETRFLSGILHPNIIKLRAVAECPPWSKSYFIVMDRLYLTLEAQIHKVWKPQADWQASWMGKVCCNMGYNKPHELWEERLVYAYDLAAALSYLHQRKILYRDVKPENIGFDVRHDIKLFDFGLARELRDHLKVDSDANTSSTSTPLYNLTANTGSPIYMAPEVALGKPYNGTCDTYSFCILLWEMLSLTLPFELYTLSKLKQRVYGKEQKRPFLQEGWPGAIQQLLEEGWAADPKQRPTMVQVETRMRKECIQLRGSAQGLEHKRRRSTHVYQPKTSSSRRGRRGSQKKQIDQSE